MNLPRSLSSLVGRSKTTLRHSLPWFAGAAALVATSCLTTTRTTVAMPAAEGAKFVGAAECAMCHENVAHEFVDATHANITWNDENGLDLSCESCHGPGSLHVEAGGGLGVGITNPDRDPSACMQCHLDTQSHFNLPSAHPVVEGKVTCTDCHDPHGSAIPAGGTELASPNQTCLTCHQAQEGPYVFEHEALREGCTVCHEPHGSVNPAMLKARNANLCLQCHMLEPVSASGAIMIGARDHAAYLPRGTCWSAGCHEAVHGSHTSSSLRY